jgi:hypothetical protein
MHAIVKRPDLRGVSQSQSHDFDFVLKKQKSSQVIDFKKSQSRDFEQKVKSLT